MSNERSIQLDYEPHINLSINTKSADECLNLSDVRYQINTIDHFIIKLISDRMQYALATVKFKLNAKPIPDNQRVIQQLIQRRKWAEQYELDPKFIESFFKSLIDWYMTQQITRYQIDNPNEPSSQFRLSSLNELKAIEFNLTWIDISHYTQLLSSAYRKTREIDEPVLVSFTQKTSTSMHPFGLFEQARRHSLSHAFLFAQPSEEFFMVGLGSIQRFDINENISSSDNINKKMTDLSYQEFQFKVKEVVDSGWKRLLINAIIENCAEKSFAGCGPLLNGGLCFDHQNHYQSPKWSHFGQASFFYHEFN